MISYQSHVRCQVRDVLEPQNVFNFICYIIYTSRFKQWEASEKLESSDPGFTNTTSSRSSELVSKSYFTKSLGNWAIDIRGGVDPDANVSFDKKAKQNNKALKHVYLVYLVRSRAAHPLVGCVEVVKRRIRICSEFLWDCICHILDKASHRPANNRYVAHIVSVDPIAP